MSKPIVVTFISDSSLSVKWWLHFHFGTSRCRWEGEESIPLTYRAKHIQITFPMQLAFQFFYSRLILRVIKVFKPNSTASFLVLSPVAFKASCIKVLSMTMLVRISDPQMCMMFGYYTQLGLVFAYSGSPYEACVIRESETTKFRIPQAPSTLLAAISSTHRVSFGGLRRAQRTIKTERL
jgi:hypothetical protein